MKKYWEWLAVTAAIVIIFVMSGTSCTHSVYLPGYEVKVMGNSNFLAGSKGAFRIITYNPSTEEPVANIPVRIFLSEDSGEKKNSPSEDKPAKGEQTAALDKTKDYGEKVFSGTTNKTGSLDASFMIPAEAEGSRKLTIVTGIAGKTTEVATIINIKKKFKIYLTTDKPLYQPGQVINIRTLALNVPGLNPVSEEEIILEVYDARGNKVFKKIGKTSKFGIAHAKFQLADEVNMGEFQVKALLGREKAEKTINVKKYVLPKFKVKFEKDRKFYTPGDTLKGEVQADYFFGKPVAGADVLVKLYTFDVEFRPVVEVKGKTDDKGHYSFEMELPDYLVGQPLEKGAAVVKMDVAVTDTADHKEKTVRMIPVSDEALKIQMMPESGTLKQGIENMVYVLTSYPDGSPAKAGLTLKMKDRSPIALNTGESGIASFTITPKNSENIPVNVRAVTPEGEEIETVVSLGVSSQGENIILRTDKGSYRVGDSIKMNILTTSTSGTYYLDFVRNRQTVSTHAVSFQGNRHEFLVDVTPDMLGMITIHAYRITADNQIIRDTRNVFVEKADDLSIRVQPDKDVYKPGEDAKIKFTVLDNNGSPTRAALGVDIVDEAVFAMGEMMPGLEKIYFLLEKQLMEPKYEIHGITLKEAVLPREQIQEDQQTVEKLIFSQIPTKQEFSVNIDTYRQKLEECLEKMEQIHQAVHEYHSRQGKWPGPGDLEILVKEDYLKDDQVIDPWGHKFYLAKPAGKNKYPDVLSAGPDGQVGDDDDLLFSNLQKDYWKIKGVRRYPLNIKFKGLPPLIAAEPREMAVENEKRDVMAEAAPPPEEESPTGGAAAKKPIRVREYFPETLYTNPEIITDEKGKAEIELKMADSITTWRLTAFANSIQGMMGSTTSGIKVFQDFFIDIDFPVALTQGDEVSVPIAVYNYLKEDQKVTLKVDTKADWFKLLDKPVKVIELKPGEVNVVYFRIKTDKIGNHKFTVYGEGTRFSDAIRREIEIVPNGKEFTWTRSDKLSQNTTTIVKIPKRAIPDASKILVRLYPGVVSQVVEGLDKIFRMPSGCFEQTTATTYPNVLVLDYMKKQKQVTPQLQMKAEGYINTGYQRLVSFEVPGGGFSWFGNAPANRCLTALGILEFRDMSRVHTVDENLIRRTQNWLASQQNQDGSWSPDENYLHANTWKKMQGGGKVPVTAYIVWALAESGYKGDDLKQGLEYLKKNAGQLKDPYVLALVCNAMAELEPQNQLTRQMLDELRSMGNISSEEAYWSTGIQTATYTHGKGANIETTALAALAFLKVKGYELVASKAVNYLIRNKDAFGTWHSTQSTILAMKALLLAQEKATEEIDANVKITVNGQRTEQFKITSENYDVFRQADFGDVTVNGENKVEITIEGKGSCYYQVAGRYYMPWMKKKPTGKKPLAIDVKYDRTELKSDDILTSNVTVKNNTNAGMKMVMVDLGIPPGFTVMTPDLNEYVGDKFKKYTKTSRQIIIYIETLKPGETLKFDYRLKAKYPLRAKTPRSRVYQYYNPEVEDVSQPVTLQVKE